MRNLRMIKFLFALSIVISSLANSAEFAGDLKFDIVNVVWGRKYTDSFLRISLPLQLCTGNLGALPPGSARYRIFTTRSDWEYMQSFPAMRKLQEMIPVDYNEIEAPDDAMSVHPKMTECHNKAIRDAWQERRALIFLSPDCLISNQMFHTILKNVQEDKRVILITGLRLKKEDMIPLVESVLEDENIRHNGLDSRSLVALSIPHLHPLSESLFCKQHISHGPANIYWWLDNENVLAFAFHLHPLFVWPETYAQELTTIDDEFIAFACPSKEKWKIIQDSDEMVAFEFSDNNNIATYGRYIHWMPCNPSNVGLWAYQSVRSHHWDFIDKPIYIHASEHKESWNEIENRAHEFIKQVLLFKCNCDASQKVSRRNINRKK